MEALLLEDKLDLVTSVLMLNLLSIILMVSIGVMRERMLNMNLMSIGIVKKLTTRT